MRAPLPGYQDIETLRESRTSRILRARRVDDGRAVVIKTLVPGAYRARDVARLRNHHEIVKDLSLAWVAPVLDFQFHDGHPFLVVEDRGGRSLASALGSDAGHAQRLDTTQVLTLAAALARALGAIHACGVIHKDIKPEHILVRDAPEQVELIDFGIATKLPSERQRTPVQALLAGTLAYMSPEQTGRMNRGIDYRTDYYSLGVVLYEMATGALPFQASDPVEMIHAHIALTPAPPAERSPYVPQALSDIVMKLMAKDAEDRYQSAEGIHADLTTCLEQWQAKRSAASFPLGRRDIAYRLHIPERLYGRESELAELMRIFERIAGGAAEAVLITGPAGIGKSALVSELYRPLVATRGYFVSGKFDQLEKNIPLSSLTDAFRGLVEQILAEPPDAVSAWRDTLSSALGADGQVLVDIIPELEHLLGKQPPAASLSPIAAQSRLSIVFERFVRALTSSGRPLVIFLDDLQWADLASLRLLRSLLTDPDMAHLLVIGAYRDNEVEAGHLLVRTVEELDTSAARVSRVRLGSLAVASLGDMIADTLRCPRPAVMPLAALVQRKTGGIPFFVGQFLETLHEGGVFRYARDEQRWHFDMDRAQALKPPDDVVELMITRLQKLPDDTREILRLAAAMGNSFEIERLAAVCERSALVVTDALWPALHEGFIETAGQAGAALPDQEDRRGGQYRFFHDRVQEAAYRLTPPGELPATHLHIARHLRERLDDTETSPLLFDVVAHLGLAMPLLAGEGPRRDLAELSLIAGRRALRATAYDVAVRCMDTGITLLGPSRWDQAHELALGLHLGAAEAAYLSAAFERSRDILDDIEPRAQELLDQVRIRELRILLCMARNRPVDAVETGLDALDLLGVALVDEVSEAELAALPRDPGAPMRLMEEPRMLAAMRILMSIGSPAFAARPELFPKIPHTMVSLSARHGVCAESTYGLSLYGMFLCGAGDIPGGYRFGQFATHLVEVLGARELACKAYLVHNVFIRHWREPARATLDDLAAAVDSGMEVGDVEYASYCAKDFCAHALFAGLALPFVAERQRSYLEILERIQIDYSTWYARIWHRLTVSLLGQQRGGAGAVADEDTIAALLAADNHSSLFAAHFARLIYAVLFHDEDASAAAMAEATRYVHVATGWLIAGAFRFYQAVALARRFGHGQQPDDDSARTIATCRDMLAAWAEHAPDSYEHRVELVDAELHRMGGRLGECLSGYERAIERARASGCVHEEALAQERAGELCLELGHHTPARAYLEEARDAYGRWGATAKVEELSARHAALLAKPAGQARGAGSLPTVEVAAEHVDVLALIKNTQQLSREIVLDDLVKSLMNIVIECAGAQRGCLLVVRDDEMWLVAEAIAGDSPHLRDVVRAADVTSMPHSVLERVRRTRTTFVLERGDEQHESDPYLRRARPRSLLCLPMLRQGQVAGVVYLEHLSASDVFTRERIATLEILAAQAAISIDNAYLYRSLEHQVEIRTRELRQARQELVDAARRAGMTEVAARLLHGFGNTLNGVHVLAMLIEERLQRSRISSLTRFAETLPAHAPDGAPWDDKHARFIVQIAQHLGGEHSLLTSDVAELKEHVDRVTRIIAATQEQISRRPHICDRVVFDEVVAEAAQHIRDGEVNAYLVRDYQAHALPILVTDRHKLLQVFIDLLDNAIDAVEVRDEMERRICLSSRRVGSDRLEIRISDNGAGIEPESISMLFQPGYTTKPDHYGFGLHACALTVGELGGTLRCESEGPGHGASFVFDIPVEMPAQPG